MSIWIPTYIDIPGGWGTRDNEWNKWDYNRPTNKALVRDVIFLKFNVSPFLEEERSEKICAIEKGALLDLLTTDVLNVIENWLAGIEHRIKFKTVVTQINGPYNPVLLITTYNNTLNT